MDLNSKYSGSVYNRSMLALGAALLVAVICSGIFLSYFILGGYRHLEFQAVDQQLRHFMSDLEREKELLSAVAKDWANWDETWEYALDRNEAFRRQNLQPQMLSAIKVDLLLILNSRGDFLESLQLINKGKTLVSTSSSTARLVASRVSLDDLAEPTSGRTDYLATKRGLLIVTALPILNSFGKKECHGTIIMGRLIDNSKIVTMSRKTGIRLRLSPITAWDRAMLAGNVIAYNKEFSDRLQLLRHTVDAHGETAVRAVGEDEVAGYRFLYDSRNRLVSLVAVYERRSIFRTGCESLVSALSLMFIIWLLFGISAFAILEAMILRPLRDMKEVVKKFNPEADSGELLRVDEKSELAELCRVINAMVTARRKMVAVLRQSQERLQLSLEGTSDILWDWDTITSKVFLSPKWAQMLGYPAGPSEISFTRWESFIHQDDQAVLDQTLHDHLEGRTPIFKCEFRVRNREGHWIWLGIRAKIAERNSDGRPARLSGLLSDIRERKLVENEQLLAAAELAGARDHALEAVEAKTRFFSNMSYEIRTSMNAVIGLANLLLESNLEPRQRENIETICASGEILLQLINNIIDMSKFESGDITFDPVDFSLNRLFDEVVESFRDKAFGKGVELLIIQRPELQIMVNGDAARIRQVLANLVDNAIRFTSQGEVVVDARFERGLSERCILRVEVRDTGIGMATEDANRLFSQQGPIDPFNKKHGVEPGLGLTLCRHFVQLMGGEITVMSELNFGSRFFFAVPVKSLDSSPVPKKWPSIPNAEGKRVLIADDRESCRRAIVGMLTDFGFFVDAVESGAKLLEVFTSASTAGELYDLVIIDSHMPDMDGFEVARWLKKAAGNNVPPIAFLMGDTQREIMLRAKATGVLLALSKPVMYAPLRDMLTDVLKKSSAATRKPGALASILRRAEASKFRLLSIEDKPINQFVIRRILEAMGFHVDTAENGVEGLALIARESFDAVLMDCQMPEMDGYETTRNIRRHEGSGKHLPIIALTAHALEGERQRCLGAGMDDYLTKPIDPELLAQTLWKVLDHSRSVEVIPPIGNEDLKVIEDRFKAMTELMGRKEAGSIWWQFLQSAPKALHDMHEALRTSNHLRLRKEAHNLRGACSIIGAVGMSDLCVLLEESDTSSGDAAANVESTLRALASGFNILLSAHAEGKLHIGTGDR
ncbi:MAG: response regulator [Candidatus Riflebacteria bacterium]|nr:response regulator [Candidatus Riflebacteria bacterium]